MWMDSSALGWSQEDRPGPRMLEALQCEDGAIPRPTEALPRLSHYCNRMATRQVLVYIQTSIIRGPGACIHIPRQNIYVWTQQARQLHRADYLIAEYGLLRLS
jgi:hypothetical protein